MISRSAEYALRIMSYLALHGTEGPMRGTDIAKETNIPYPYLSKVMRRMVEADLLSASKGHHGGFSLAKSASKIRFVDILDVVEGGDRTPVCVFGWSKCSDVHPCALHNRWKPLRTSFLQWAEKTTLADVRKDMLEKAKK